MIHSKHLESVLKDILTTFESARGVLYTTKLVIRDLAFLASQTNAFQDLGGLVACQMKLTWEGRHNSAMLVGDVIRAWLTQPTAAPTHV